MANFRLNVMAVYIIMYRPLPVLGHLPSISSSCFSWMCCLEQPSQLVFLKNLICAISIKFNCLFYSCILNSKCFRTTCVSDFIGKISIDWLVDQRISVC